MTVTQCVAQARNRIAAAAVACGRDPREISLVAAAKHNPPETIREAVAAGVDAVGENRVQELLAKYDQGAYENIPLHFIGALQKNKIKGLIGKVSLIHSVDSLSLARAVEKESARKSLTQDILLEVNIGRELSKSGILPEDALQTARELLMFDCIRLRGLMCIPPPADPTALSHFFLQMKQLYVDIRDKKGDNSCVQILSMGMSGDFELAIAHGSTMVRLGQALFGPRL